MYYSYFVVCEKLKHLQYFIMINLVIFDLDGVLVDAKELHYEALNQALPSDYRISLKEHHSIYDGLKTNQKLDILNQRKGLDKSLFKSIWDKKQKITMSMLNNLTVRNDQIEIMKYLKSLNIKIAIASNSIRDTVEKVIEKHGLQDLIDLVVSNQDVINSKPHPEMYWKVMSELKFLPENTLIVEDSPYGLLAAKRSNASVLRIKDSKNLSLDMIKTALAEKSYNKISYKWENKKMNVLIPMAGAGSRFQEAGYTFPKPLIEVRGKPMIQVVIENLNIDATYIFVVQKEHREKYKLDSMLNLIVKKCKIIEVDGLTEGAACTALLAKEHIDNNDPLFFANSDQFVEWNSTEFMYKMSETECDGGIVTFKATHPKWSFAKVNDEGLVTEVAEKKPISDNATVGFYYWKKGSDFVKNAEEMIKKDIRVNNEFYVCPVFNQAIQNNLQIRSYEIDKMWGLGTPEDLNYFVENYKNENNSS